MFMKENGLVKSVKRFLAKEFIFGSTKGEFMKKLENSNVLFATMRLMMKEILTDIWLFTKMTSICRVRLIIMNL